MRRTLYVDGSNLYHGITDILPPGQYIDFGHILDAIQKEIAISKVKFYGAYMKTDLADPLRRHIAKAQVEFFNATKQIPYLQFKKGHYNNHAKEKGIDVKLAVDLVRDAYEDGYDEAVVMSGDDDFLYAVDAAKQLKPLHMAAFGSRYGYNLAHKTNTRLVFGYSHYFERNIFPTLKRPPDRLKIIDLGSDIPVLGIQKPDAHHAG
jgi:uncharacterized LabA/DUF88 family protein